MISGWPVTSCGTLQGQGVQVRVLGLLLNMLSVLEHT